MNINFIEFNIAIELLFKTNMTSFILKSMILTKVLCKAKNISTENYNSVYSKLHSSVGYSSSRKKIVYSLALQIRDL